MITHLTPEQEQLMRWRTSSEKELLVEILGRLQRIEARIEALSPYNLQLGTPSAKPQE